VTEASLSLARVIVYSLILFVGLITFVFEQNFINITFYYSFYSVLLVSLIFNFLFEVTINSNVKSTSKIISWIRNKTYILGFIDVATVGALMFSLKGPLLLFTILFMIFILISSLQNGMRQGLIISLWSSMVFTVVSALIFENINFNYILTVSLHNIAFIGLSVFVGFFGEQFFEVQSQVQRMGLSLKALQELNRIIMNHLPVGVVSFTESGEVLSLNPFGEKILNKDLIKDEKIDLSKYGVDLLNLNKETKTEVHLLDSKILSFSHKIYRDENEKMNIHIAVVEDLTDIRKYEGIARQNEKLAAIGGLAAGIAHEIRNPLASISGSVELLSQTTHNEDDQKLMKIVLKEIQRLNNLITEFLDYARPEKPYTDKVNLSLLINDVLEHLKQDKKLTQNISQIINLLENVFITGHGEKLKQVFLNLFVNAYQALSHTKEASILCQMKKVEDQIQILIQDNGMGMNAEVQRRLFEPFFTTKSKGTGLGLAITHKIIQSHRGSILVQSEEGKGTVFTLTFPISST